MAKLQDIITRIRQAVELRERELQAMKKLLTELEATAQSLSPSGLEAFESALTEDHEFERSWNAIESSTQRRELSPREIASAVRDVLLDAKRPMRRGEIVSALEARGVPLGGKDKNKNVGTIIWRHPQQFISLERLGYWLRDVPLPGVYSPDE
jgi:hypothetical protein